MYLFFIFSFVLHIHLFYHPSYLNNNIYFLIFNYYFIFLFCSYLFIFSFVLNPFFFVLISFLRDPGQALSFFTFFLLPFTVNSVFLSSLSNHLPPQASSSSFSSHALIIYPPQPSISTTRIKTHHHHKNQNPQARSPSTHKHRSPPPAPIHKHQNPFPSTH